MIPWPVTFLSVLIVFNVLLIVVLRIRPQVVRATGGKALAFLALCVLPIVSFGAGTSHHLEQAKSTEFCLSCHAMEPYGRSLTIDSLEHLPATHVQNNRVPREAACYACHTDYTMFGDLQAKLRGARHLWVNYVGTIPETLSLYEPFSNHQCLQCHAGGRTFEENAFHDGSRAELANDEVSCLVCHGPVHDVANLDTLPTWEPPATAPRAEERR